MELVQKVVKILTSLTSSQQEIKRELREAINIFLTDSTESIRIETLTSGLLPPLLGILRCSEDIEILLLAVQCIAVITHGCDAVRLELAKFDTVEILLSLLSPRDSDNNKLTLEREWEWVQVQEHVLIALKKITFHCEPNQASFINLGGAGKIVGLCHSDSRNESNYPPEMIKRLSSLVVDQLLIASVSPVPASEKSKMKSYFPVLSHLKDINYPVYYVDLADSNKKWITDTLVLEGLALPSTKQFPEDISWIIARGTHVSGPNVIWLQYSVDKTPQHVNVMFTSLKQMALPQSSSELAPPLSPGSVYAIYHKGAWLRGWLLQPPDVLGNHTFFCMDYGYTVVVKLRYVRPLPDKCRGIPPQAVPAVLIGISPPPRSYFILENVAAILGNIAFEKDVYRMEIKSANGVQLMLELIEVNDSKVKQCALSALLNLAHSTSVCQLLRQLGAIQTLLVLLTSTEDVIVIKWSLGTLQNMLIFDSVACLEVVETFKVYDKIKEWLKSAPDDVINSANGLLFTIEGLIKGLIPETKIDQQNKLTCAPFPIQTSKHSLTNSTKSKHTPVYRVLSDTKRERSPVDPPTITPVTIETECIEFNSKLKYLTHESVHFYNITDVSMIFEEAFAILKSLCALANEQYGGSIYIGVDESGCINGVQLGRSQKDNIRLDIDRLTEHLVPPLDRYKVLFMPVVGGAHNSYVIHIKVLPSLTNVVHVVQLNKFEKCYSSLSGKSVKLNLHEVQELVATREVQKYEQLYNNNHT